MRRLLFTILGLSACVNPVASNRLRDELRDQGVIQVSPNNPFVAANQFLAKEAAESSVVQGFLELRGAPDAIEVRRPFFKPYRFYFFYVDSTEGYLLEPLGDEWIIRGPEQIPNDIVEEKLSKIRSVGGKAPLKLAPQRVQQRAPSEAVSAEKPPSVETPVQRVRDKPLAMEETAPPPQRKQSTPWPGPGTKEATSDAGAIHQELPEEAAPKRPSLGSKNTELSTEIPRSRDRRSTRAMDVAPTQTKQMETPASSAARSEDVLHVVRFPGETLRMIANWYTGDSTNAERISRINGLENANQLTMGNSIRIPRYLLQTKDAMPEGEIERYLRNVR